MEICDSVQHRSAEITGVWLGSHQKRGCRYSETFN
jgi:hypothetical protein